MRFFCVATHSFLLQKCVQRPTKDETLQPNYSETLNDLMVTTYRRTEFFITFPSLRRYYGTQLFNVWDFIRVDFNVFHPFMLQYGKKRTVRNEEDMEKNTSTVKMLRSLRKMGKLSVVMMAAIINKENKEMKARNKA